MCEINGLYSPGLWFLSSGKCYMNFLTRLSDRGYTDEFFNSAINRHSSTAQNISNDQLFFKFPYINDTIEGRIKSIIKKAHQQIHITRRGHNIRALLSKKTIKNCSEISQSSHVVHEYTKQLYWLY